MVLKSIGKKLDRVFGGSKKDKGKGKSVETPPVRGPEREAPKWVKPGSGPTSKGEGPVIGKNRVVTKGPTGGEGGKWTVAKPGVEKPGTGETPVIGGNRRAWKKGESDEKPRGGVTIGQGRAKAKVVETPKDDEPKVVEVPKGKEPEVVESKTEEPKTYTPIESEGEGGTSNYTTPVGSNYLTPGESNYTAPTIVEDGDDSGSLSDSVVSDDSAEGGGVVIGDKYLINEDEGGDNDTPKNNYAQTNGNYKNKYLVDEGGDESNYKPQQVEDSGSRDSKGNYKPREFQLSGGESQGNGSVSTTLSSSSGDAGPVQVPKSVLLARVRQAKQKKLEAEAKKRAAERREQARQARENRQQQELAKSEEKTETPPQNYLTQGGSNYTTQGGGSNYTTQGDGSNYTTQGDGSNYTTQGDGSNYLQPSTNYATTNYQQGQVLGGGEREMLSISDSDESDAILTSIVGPASAHTGEIDLLSDLEDQAQGQLEVQDKYGGSKDTKVKEMQSKLREGRRYLHDTPENVHGKLVPVERERLTTNERKSEGWSLLGLRTGHKGRDVGKEGGGWQVAYALSAYRELEQDVVKFIGDKMSFDREDLLCEIYGGKLVDVRGLGVDTSSGGVLGQAQNERMQRLREKIKAAKENGLGDKVAKLEQKLDIAWHKPAQDKNLSGKFIYVMNAGGQFFATKPELFKIHHSTMLAGGAVACAGEIAVSGGQIQLISNLSGHYRPGPAYLWQAVKQLEMSGASMGFKVDCMGVSKKFKTGTEFLGAMDPSSDPQLHNAEYAIKHLNGHFSGGR